MSDANWFKNLHLNWHNIESDYNHGACVESGGYFLKSIVIFISKFLPFENNQTLREQGHGQKPTDWIFKKNYADQAINWYSTDSVLALYFVVFE